MSTNCYASLLRQLKKLSLWLNRVTMHTLCQNTASYQACVLPEHHPLPCMHALCQSTTSPYCAYIHSVRTPLQPYMHILGKNTATPSLVPRLVRGHTSLGTRLCHPLHHACMYTARTPAPTQTPIGCTTSCNQIAI